MTYELIGTPRIETEYSDAYETTMVCDVCRDDGVTGDVWIVAGVPDYLRGSSDAARTMSGYTTVRVFGDSPAHWLSDSLMPKDDPNNDELRETRDAIISACESAALATHQGAMAAREDAE